MNKNGTSLTGRVCPTFARAIFLFAFALIYPVNLFAVAEPPTEEPPTDIVYGATEEPEGPSRTDYYVCSVEGDDYNHDGRSLGEAFETIGKAVETVNGSDATGHYKIWIKAGRYENEVIPKLAKSNVVIEGYRQDNLGEVEEIDQSEWEQDKSARKDSWELNDYNYETLGVELSDQRMPLIVGVNREDPNYIPCKEGSDDCAQKDKHIAFSVENLTPRITNLVFRNLQITNYPEGGIRSYADNATFENVYIYSTEAGYDREDESQIHSGGAGLISDGDMCEMRYCVVVNSWGTNIAITGNENHAENCISACLQNLTDNGTDYYFLTNGDHNVVKSCKLIRTHQEDHGGHGFMTQVGTCNQFFKCESDGVVEAIQLIALKGPTSDNSYTGFDIKSGGIILSTGANNNTFTDCTVDGAGEGAGVQFWRSYPFFDGTDEDDYPYPNDSNPDDTNDFEHITDVPPKDNQFTLCNFSNLKLGLDFNRRDIYLWGEPAANNIFFDCVFNNIYALIRTQRPHTNTVFAGSGSTFSRVLHLHHNDGFPHPEIQRTGDDFLHKAEFQFSDSTFSDNGFQTPKGTGNNTLNTDLKYPPRGDIQLGLVGHWTFDDVKVDLDAGEVYDSSNTANTNNLTGILRGNATTSPDGKLGQCLQLNGGSDYVLIGDELDLVESDMTIAAWIKADQFVASGGIVNKGGNYRLASGGNVEVSNQIAGGALAYKPDGPDGPEVTPAQHDAGRDTPLNENQWYHVALVLDRTTSHSVKIYVDGILRTNDGIDLTSGRADTPHFLEIGRAAGNIFNGLIDDVRIYDRALDIYDMKALADYRDPSSGLVGHWKFDETNGDTAYESSESEPGLDGTLVGDASWNADGKLGGCIYLDGNGDYVSIGDKLDLVDSDISIAAWVKPENWVGGIVDKFGPGGNYRLIFGNQPAKLAGQGKESGSNTILGSIAENTSLALDEWHHVSIVFDSANEESNLYVDGILCSQDNFTIARGDTLANLIIGRSFGNHFRGSIDDVRIYNQALDAKSIEILAEVRDPSSGLVGHWKFDEVSGGIAYESSGSEPELDGTLLGDAMFDNDGKLGGCIYLDGQGDYVSIGDKLDLVDSNISIAAWIKPETWNGGIIDKLGPGGNYRLIIGNQPAKLVGQAREASNYIETVFAEDTSVAIDQWHHVAVVFDLDSQKLSMYVDGFLCSEAAYTISRGDTGAYLNIGKFFGHFFQGSIDDVRIYNKALDSFDMQALVYPN